MTSHKASMAAKCSGALNIKNPLTPYVKPQPNGGSETPADNSYQTFMNCMYPNGDNKGSASSACFSISCGDPANSAHECCKGKGKADPSALKLQELFLKQCAAVKCAEGSTDPCCPGFAKNPSRNPGGVDTRKYAPYSEPQRAQTPSRNDNSR
jgi:hypothetical protein